MPLAVSMALPPPTLTMASAPTSRPTAAPRSTMWTPESGSTSENTPAQAAPRAFSTRAGMSVARAKPESVTSSARLQPSACSSTLTSREQPEPNTTRVVFMLMKARLSS